LESLDNYFYRGDENIQTVQLIINNTYFDYINIISFTNYYYINEIITDNVNIKLNYNIIYNLISEIKGSDISKIYNDTNLEEYLFIKAKD
jgi:hypothetical protein